MIKKYILMRIIIELFIGAAITLVLIKWNATPLILNIIFLIILGLGFIGGLLIAVLDTIHWNGGQCKQCGAEWEHYDTDSQGGKGLKCKCPDGEYWWLG